MMTTNLRFNPTKIGYAKRMIEIWRECERFPATSETLTYKVRSVIKKGRFSDFEILEIHQQI